MATDSTKRTYWFPAKRYGWGWGPPVTWQGWVVFAAWLVVFGVGLTRFAAHGLPAILLWVIAMTAAILSVCYWKGEPPRWRWGERG